MANMAPQATQTSSMEEALQEIRELRAKVAAMEAGHDRVTKLLAQQEGAQTPDLVAHKEWCQLPAKAKTQLVIDKLYGPAPGKKLFHCVHTDAKGKVSADQFDVKLHAHSPEEAETLYRKVMGIRNTTGTITATLAA